MSDLPPHVAAAAAIVDAYLKAQPPVAETLPPAAPKLTDAQKWARCREFDQSKMPPWKDPRGA
jgi:hypothetical protein